MIVIWDNGEHYDNHGVYFIDIVCFSPNNVVDALKDRHPDGFIVGISEDIEWYAPNKPLTLSGFCYWYQLMENDKPTILSQTIDLGLFEHLLVGWETECRTTDGWMTKVLGNLRKLYQERAK